MCNIILQPQYDSLSLSNLAIFVMEYVMRDEKQIHWQDNLVIQYIKVNFIFIAI